jgi:hypothetical protein
MEASNNSIFSLPATPIFHKGCSWPIVFFRGILIFSNKTNFKQEGRATINSGHIQLKINGMKINRKKYQEKVLLFRKLFLDRPL